MIKFFRQIRKKLVTRNQVKSYLLYAIGEIALVVIGILLALQVNNWNQNRKLDSKRQVYYQQLLDDLNKDKEYAGNTIEKFEGQRKEYQAYLKKFEGDHFSVKDMYQSLTNLNFESYTLNFNTSTIESLQNSGDIGLIPPTLRNKLVDLKRSQEKIAGDELLDNKGKNSVAERVVLLTGSPDLKERIKNHDNLKSALDIEGNMAKIILGHEATLSWMNFSELKSIRLLKEILIETDDVINHIQNEMNSDD